MRARPSKQTIPAVRHVPPGMAQAAQQRVNPEPRTPSGEVLARHDQDGAAADPAGARPRAYGSSPDGPHHGRSRAVTRRQQGTAPPRSVNPRRANRRRRQRHARAAPDEDPERPVRELPTTWLTPGHCDGPSNTVDQSHPTEHRVTLLGTNSPPVLSVISLIDAGPCLYGVPPHPGEGLVRRDHFSHTRT